MAARDERDQAIEKMKQIMSSLPATSEEGLKQRILEPDHITTDPYMAKDQRIGKIDEWTTLDQIGDNYSLAHLAHRLGFSYAADRFAADAHRKLVLSGSLKGFQQNNFIKAITENTMVAAEGRVTGSNSDSLKENLAKMRWKR